MGSCESSQAPLVSRNIIITELDQRPSSSRASSSRRGAGTKARREPGSGGSGRPSPRRSSASAASPSPRRSSARRNAMRDAEARQSVETLQPSALTAVEQAVDQYYATLDEWGMEPSPEPEPREAASSRGCQSPRHKKKGSVSPRGKQSRSKSASRRRRAEKERGMQLGASDGLKDTDLSAPRSVSLASESTAAGDSDAGQSSSSSSGGPAIGLTSRLVDDSPATDGAPSPVHRCQRNLERRPTPYYVNEYLEAEFELEAEVGAEAKMPSTLLLRKQASPGVPVVRLNTLENAVATLSAEVQRLRMEGKARQSGQARDAA